MARVKSTWNPKMNRYERMRAAWVDAMRQGLTKLPFAQFEERMLKRDLEIKKEEFFKRRIIVEKGTLLHKVISNTLRKKAHESVSCKN